MAISEDEDTKMRLEDSGRKAEEEMAKLTEQMTQGEVEEPEEVQETDEKADSTAPVDAQKTPEEESATSTPPEDEKPPVDEGAERKDAPEKASEGEKASTEEKKEETEPPDEVDKEIDSTNLRPDAHPKTKKALDKVKTIAKREHRERKIVEKRIKALEDEKASLKLLDEPTEKELQELRNFRKTVDIEHDPEFTQKYSQRIETLDKSALETLTADNLSSTNRLPKPTADFIQANGGVLRFRSSSNYMPAGLKDAQGNPIATHEDGTPFTHREFWEKLIAPSLTAEQNDAINDYGIESRRLLRERQEKLTEAKSNIDQWEKNRGEQTQLQQKEFSDRFEKRAKEYAVTFGDVAVRKQVPTNATKDEKDVIDKHNQRVDRAEGIAKRYASTMTPETHAEMVLNSAYVETMRELDKEKDASIDNWKKRAETAEKKLDDIKNAGKTANKQSAPAHKTEKKETIYGQDPEAYMVEQMKAQGLA